jgi:hypothetical protein
MKAFSVRDEEQAAQLFQVRPFALHLSIFHMLPLTTAFLYNIGFIPQLNIGFSSPPSFTPSQQSTELFKQALALEPINEK